MNFGEFSNDQQFTTFFTHRNESASSGGERKKVPVETLWFTRLNEHGQVIVGKMNENNNSSNVENQVQAIHDYDVLLGRGKLYDKHLGNQNFQGMCSIHILYVHM